jgi:isopenicillin N synthase-like dioxygenase
MKKINHKQIDTISDSDNKELRADLKELGCFIFEDCLDKTLVEIVHQALIRLFSTPQDVKDQCFIDKKQDPLGPGFSPFGVAKALDTGIANLLETWDVSPDKINWPSGLDTEWKTLREYQTALSNAAKAGLTVLAASLGVEREEILNLIDQDSIEGIHLIHYFPLSKESSPDARRQSQHCDNTLVTLIPSPYPISTGLDIFNRKTKQWEHVVIPKGSCLIQAGLILEYITCGAIKANLHTVSNPKFGTNENASRYSTPFFRSPKAGSTVRILEKYKEGCGEKDVSLEEMERQYFKKIF